jgi:hypothetical protein
MEVATTSQMLFCNIIFKLFLAKYSIWLCTGFSVAQNGAVVNAHQPKPWSLDFNFTTYDLPTARAFDILAGALNASVTSSTNTYILCVIGQCAVLGDSFGTSTPTRQRIGSQERETTRRFEKLP